MKLTYIRQAHTPTFLPPSATLTTIIILSSSNSGSSLESICSQNIHWDAPSVFGPNSILGSPCHGFWCHCAWMVF